MPAPIYPPPQPGIPRITQSALETYLRCGLRYQFEREAGAHRHATVRMLIGSAVAAGASYDNRAKILEGKPAALGQIVDAAVADYEIEADSSDIPETTFEISAGKDEAAGAARAFGVQVSPQITDVLAAEVPMLAVIRGIQLAGTPDYVTRAGLGDGKTGQPWTQARADRSRQLAGYGILHRINLGRYPERLWIDSLSKRRGAWTAERWWTARRPEDYRAFLFVAESAVRSIEMGRALPAPEGAWFCSKAFCPFWGRCPAVGNG